MTTAATQTGQALPALVIENDPTDDLCRLGEWLADAGLQLRVLRPHAYDELPDDLDGFSALIVLGGEQNAYPEPDGTPAADWFPKLESLLRKAVRNRLPTLGICLGGQLLAQAHGGLVERSPSGPEIGAKLVARRDIAEQDVLWSKVPFAPDVIQYHYDEIVELPAGATLLAASPRYPNQAFRLGDRAWGTQFHIETDVEMFEGWMRDNTALFEESGWDVDTMIEEVEQTQDDVREVWQPFAERFAQLALGKLEDDTRRQLPLIQ